MKRKSSLSPVGSRNSKILKVAKEGAYGGDTPPRRDADGRGEIIWPAPKEQMVVAKGFLEDWYGVLDLWIFWGGFLCFCWGSRLEG